MTSTYPPGSSVVLDLQFTDREGNPVAPVSASYRVVDHEGTELLPTTSIDVTDSPLSAVVAIEGAINSLSGEIRGVRFVEFVFDDDRGRSYQQRVAYIVEAADALVAGTNSVVSLGSALLLLLEKQLPMLTAATDEEKARALAAAFYNIDKIALEIPRRHHHHHRHHGCLPKKLRCGPFRVSDLTAEDLETLKANLPRVHKQLAFAQLTEAEGILGGFPVEDRRASDLISESSGESAHFFRTSKPVELPVYRATMNELTGLVRWSVGIGRG